jgi:co-chaperonin GroES (HSP10)
MRILGNRVLVSRVEEPQSEGFTTVQVQDSFTYKGKVEQTVENCGIPVGSVVMFARNSPDTQDIEHEGKKLKVVRVEDIIAIL